MGKISNEFWKKHNLYNKDIDRTDPALVQVVEELGKTANGMCAKLTIVDLPTGTLYRIDEYDGYESIETNNNIEWKVSQVICLENTNET